MTTFMPFENDSQVMSLGNLSVENGTDKLMISGNLDILANAEGLAALLDLQRFVSSAIAYLQKHPNIKTQAEPTDTSVVKKNPFI